MGTYGEKDYQRMSIQEKEWNILTSLKKSINVTSETMCELKVREAPFSTWSSEELKKWSLKHRHAKKLSNAVSDFMNGQQLLDLNKEGIIKLFQSNGLNKIQAISIYNEIKA